MKSREVVQDSFAGGVVDTALVARPDVPQRLSGLRSALNWLVTTIGTLQNRPGTVHHVRPKDAHDDLRTKRFRVDNDTAFMIELGDGYLRLIQAGAFVLTGSQATWANDTCEVGDVRVGSDAAFYYCLAPHTNKDPTSATNDEFWYELEAFGGSAILELPTPWSQAQLASLRFTQSGKQLFLNSGAGPTHELVRVSDTHWTLLPSRWVPDIAAPGVRITATGSGSGNWDLRYRVEAVKGDGETVDSLPCYDDDNKVTSAKAIDSATAQSTTDDLEVAHTGHGLVDGDEIYILSVSTVDATRNHYNAVLALEGAVYLIEKIDDDIFRLKDTAGLLTLPPMTGGTYPDLQITYALAWVGATGATQLNNRTLPAGDSGQIQLEWDAVPGAKSYRVYRRRNEEAFGLQAEVTKPEYRDRGIEENTEFPPKTYRNPFRGARWPATASVHQQRLFLGSTETDPQDIYGGRVGALNDLSRHRPTEANDGLGFKADSLDSNRVVHLAALGQLIIFSTGSIQLAAGGGDGQLEPGVYGLKVLGYEGVGDLEPLLIGDAAFFTEAGNSTVREFGFSLDQGGLDGYRQANVIRYARDLFRGYSIVDWDFSRVPDPIVWAVRSDGKLLALTYMREEGILAWHLHETGVDADDRILQVTVLREGGVDIPYLLVKRTVDGNTVYAHESLAPRDIGVAGTDHREVAHFLDAGVQVNGRDMSRSTTLTLTDGTTWAAGELGLVLTAGSATFTADSEGYRLEAADGSGDEVEVVVTAFNSDTEVVVTLLTACPASLQGLGTVDWVELVSTVDGLDHLEGRQVYARADGRRLGPFTVASGEIDLDDGRPYGMISVGLGYLADAELFDLADIPGLMDNVKSVTEFTAHLRDSQGVRAGPDLGDLSALQVTSDDEDVPLTGQRTAGLGGTYTDHGRVRLVSTEGQPAEVLAVVRHMAIGG